MKKVRQYVAMAAAALMIASLVPSSVTYADSATNIDVETNEVGDNSLALGNIDEDDLEISEESIEEINSNDTDIEISNISESSASITVNNATSSFNHLVISYVAKNNPDDYGTKILTGSTSGVIEGLKANTEYEVTVNQINLNMSSNGHMADPTSTCLGKVDFKTLAGEINSDDIEISKIGQNSAFIIVNNATPGFNHLAISYVAKNNPDDYGTKILTGSTSGFIEGLKADTEYEVTVNQINLNMSSNGHMANPTSTCLGKVDFKTLAGSGDSSTESGDFLILVGESLYENSQLKESLDVYKQDLINEGINPEIIRISKTDGTSDGADGVYNCKGHTEVKAVIKSRYDKGAKGFVIIGSGEDIPSAFVEVSADSEDTFPSDVYFADMDEDWIDDDNDGLYEQMYAKDKYHEYKPEMYYGRISAAGISHFGKKTEAEYIKLYLDRVHNYRINGSNLSSEAQERGLTFVDNEDFRWKKTYNRPIANILPNVKGVYDEDETCKTNWIDELNTGYSVIHLTSHSSNYINTFSIINKFEDFFNECSITAYDVINRDDIKPKFNFLDLSACSACCYEDLDSGAIINMGEAYLYKDTSLGLNVDGASYTCYGTAVQYDEQFYNDLMNKIPVGIAYKDSVIKNDVRNTLYSVLLGDPTIKYNIKNLDNSTPYINTNLTATSNSYQQDKYKIAFAGTDFEIEAYDNDGDEQVYFDFEDTLPDGVTTRQENNVIYLNFPTEMNKEDKIYSITVNVFNKDSNGEKINNYKELFYVQVIQPKEYKATSPENDKNCTTAEPKGLGYSFNKVEASKDNYITYNNIHIEESGFYNITIKYCYGGNQIGLFKVVGDDTSQQTVNFSMGKGTEEVKYVYLEKGDYSFNISASTDDGLPYMVSLIVAKE